METTLQYDDKPQKVQAIEGYIKGRMCQTNYKSVTCYHVGSLQTTIQKNL